jgi:hypothetical protein
VQYSTFTKSAIITNASLPYWQRYPMANLVLCDEQQGQQLSTVPNTNVRNVHIVSRNAQQTYITMDDCHLQKLKLMGWDVDNGVIELIPAAVIVCNDDI